MVTWTGTDLDRPAWRAEEGFALIAVLDRDGHDVPADKIRLDKADWKKNGSSSHFRSVSVRSLPGSVVVIMEHSHHGHGADCFYVLPIEGGERLGIGSVRSPERPPLQRLSEPLRDAVIDRVIASCPYEDKKAALAYRWAKAHEDGLV